MPRQPKPGISRTRRISDEGLARLEKQLQGSSPISDTVLTQWIRRYGDAARELVRAANRYHEELEP